MWAGGLDPPPPPWKITSCYNIVSLENIPDLTRIAIAALRSNNCISREVGTTQGVSLICPYIRRLGPFFGVQHFEFQYFLGVSEKIFGFITKSGLYLWVISMHFTVFS